MCDADCEAEFNTCVTEGPGYTTCMEELTDFTGRIADVCTEGCNPTAAMLALNDDHMCTQACEAEYLSCVQYGPGPTGCTQELRDCHGMLCSKCQPGCQFTSAMNSAGSSNACTAACAEEFNTCCTHGPGYSQCVSELRGGTGPLGAVCTSTCSLTDTMLALNNNMCTHSCEREFTLCVTEGPGYDQCVVELNEGSSPLAGDGDDCTAGCAMTDTMMALASNSGGTPSDCSTACASEFSSCVNDGPGYQACVGEIRDNVGPLGAVCDASCILTAAMEAMAPSSGDCSTACANEFVTNCVPHYTTSTTSGCSQCRQEIESQTGPLAAAGCTPGCTDTASMTNACP